MADVNLTDNSGEVMDALKDAINRALVTCGLVAEGHAKDKCPYDTGRLRGSIVYATSTQKSTGQEPAEPKDYTPKDEADEGYMYIGTNVEYAQAVELGTSKQKAQPFLRPAIENHISEYKRLIESELRGG